MQTFLFDLDGTLTESRRGLVASFRAGLEAIGAADLTDTELARYLGTPLPLMFQAVRPGINAGGIERGIEAFRAHYNREGILGNELYPAVKDMLQALQERGSAAWLVTSKPQDQALRVVALLGLESLIDGVVGAGLDETDTKTELVARALREAGASAGSTLMLGDRHYDIVGARENGVEPVGALWGYGSAKELSDAGCRYFAQSPADFTSRWVVGDMPRTQPVRTAAAA